MEIESCKSTKFLWKKLLSLIIDHFVILIVNSSNVKKKES